MEQGIINININPFKALRPRHERQENPVTSQKV